jgi:hypothetical protein
MPAFYITLEKDLPEFASGTGEGCELSRQEPQLTALAKSLGLKPLMEFFSIDPKEAADFLEDSDGDEEIDIPAQQWFSAADGLITIRGLTAHIGTDPSTVANADKLLKELEEFEKVLDKAKAEDVGWCLGIDY